jgi:hypothetical protein
MLSNGIGSASMYLSGIQTFATANYISSFISTRNDIPYGTQHLGVSTATASAVTSQKFGKLDNGLSGGQRILQRTRLGLSFSMPDLTKLISAYLTIQFSTYTNTIEPFNIGIYMSNTDDSAGSGTWYNNVNNYCNYAPYGSSGIKSYDLPVSVLKTRSSAKASFILGEVLSIGGGDGELFGTGVAGTVTHQASTFAWDATGYSIGAQIGLNFSP